MKAIRTAWCVILLTALAGLAGQDGHFTYQGKLVQGSNLVNGTVAMKLRIYTNDVGGAFIYEESNLVTVVDGYYSFLVGKQPNYGQLKKALKHNNPHIEIEVDGDVLAPREPFNPPPFAENAESVWRTFGNINNMESMDVYTNGWAKLLGNFEIIGALAETDRTPDWAHSFILFPPPIEDKEVVGVKIIRTGDLTTAGGHTSRPILTVKVVGHEGLPKRVISEPMQIKDMLKNAWTNFVMIGTAESRTLSEDEMLLIHHEANTNDVVGSCTVADVMVQVRVR